MLTLSFRPTSPFSRRRSFVESISAPRIAALMGVPVRPWRLLSMVPLGGYTDESSKLEACVNAVVWAVGRRRECRARSTRGEGSRRERGPRSFPPDPRCHHPQGHLQPDGPWRRCDHLGQGGLHLLGTELRERRLSRFR